MPRESHIAELRVLRRKDALIIDENDWPQFDLREAEVRAGDGSLTSLFLAGSENPVNITGQLIPKGSNPLGKAAVLPTYRSKVRIPILVDQVTYFAFGIFDTGSYAIWAAGEAGWHTIYPSKSYEEIFEHMIEGLSVLYYLVEAYEDGKKMHTEDLFLNYAKANKITPKEAANRFYSHATFLASRMGKGEEGIKWGHTSFYQHLRKTHPEAFNLRTRSAAPLSKAATAAPSKASNSTTRTTNTKTQARETSSRSQSADVRPTRAATAAAATAPTPANKITQASEPAQPQSVPKKVGRPRTQSKQTQSQPSLLSEMNRAKAKDVWRFIQRKTNEMLPEIGEMTVETFARFLFQEYQFQDENEAQYFLKYLAPDLVGIMSIPRNRSYDPWTELPIYDELVEAKVPPRVKGRVASLKLQKRNKPLPGEDDDTETSNESSEESVLNEDEARSRKREAARRRISALRPKGSSKYSGKAAKRKGKEKATAEIEDEEMLDTDVDANANEDAMSVDTVSKRKGISDDEDEEEEPEYPNKRFTRSQGDLDPELEDLEFEIQQTRSTGLPIRRKASLPTLANSSKQTPTRMGLISEPVPSTDANAPGDVWNCPHIGCVRKVYGASEYESKELIREHLLDHKEEERVDLIRNEESMTRLPVSHLLRRIREIAERTGGEQLKALEGGMVGLFPPGLERKVY